MKRFYSILMTALLLNALGDSRIYALEAVGDDHQAMMAKMKELTSPQAAHELLSPLVGQWNYTAKFWMAPDAQPEETTGTSHHALIYGGRFLQQEVQGVWMGEPFIGTGLLGHDNVKGEYVNVWYDNMATGIMTISGKYDAATKTLHLSGTNSCPLTGEAARPCRAEYTFTDNDHNAYSSYTTAPDGKEFKAMEILYTRG